MDGLHSNLQAIDEVFINIECDFNSTPPTCFNQTTALLNLTEQHAVAEIKRILDEKQSNDVDGVIGNIQTKADVLGTTVSEDVQQLTDAINTLKDGLNNFFEKIANITDYDITTYLGDITSQLDAAINSNIKPDNISAMTESLSNLNNLTSIVDKEIELVQEKLFCSGVDGYTGLPYLSDLSSHTAHCQKVANLTKELYSFVSGEPTFHKLIVTLQEVTAGHGNETQTLMVAAEGLEEIHTNIDNCGLDSFATLSSSFLNDLPLENITAPVDYAKNAVNGLEEQANDMISTLDSTLKGKLSSLSEMNNPLGGVEEKYNTAAEPVIKYVGAGSYAMAAMFVLLVVLYVVQLLFTFCCPKQCCLCCCQCVDFAYFLIFGLVILLFGILGCLLREASRFVYGGEFLQFAKQSGLMEQVAEMLPLSSLDMQPVAVLGTTIDLKSIIDLDAAKLYGIMEFYWVANSEAENPLATIVSKLKDTINSLIDGIADIESTGIVPSNIKLGTETKRIVSTGASAVKNHTDGAFDSVSQLIAPDSISKTMFSALDVVFLALTNVMILFWLCSFWLSMFVILHVCCLGSGRTYWPPYKAPKGGEKEEDGDEDEESENEGNSNENGEDDGLTEHERRKKRRKERRERKKLQEMQMLSMQLGIAPQVATGIGMGMGMGAGMEMGMGMGSGMGMGIGMGAFDNPAEVYPVQGQMVMPSPNAQPMAAFPSEQMMPGNGMFMSEYT
ncbi:uncharacterized protein MONOS_2894 [Monocercomonoides exilis]|uniref:uncharacterized protein n=1 Tax=Monocercomonoides exilis TaxID=2049356 RepID=UPI003559A9DC|nr:hypothetical protein MONOS_2894 [Monocercomonoides exilis]|eukprot:MONOS_2894.1-p1 / transcript=MONOS_2894.1 / gene=MONOS_2894 / organism=Monocercomonoides_exilis_PA203 / gene_product=unspecified product / transcript_product=unspecified product / location=Mono_scaffold00063:36837-39345(-) / protein_length=729 / sequence_SO=supercontig / SO=protein_coding / is_pseudo=false